MKTIIKEFLQITWKEFVRHVRILGKQFKLTHRLSIFCIKYGNIVGCARISLIPL